MTGYGESGEMVILRLSKEFRLLSKREEITIVRLGKVIRLLGKTGEMGIVRNEKMTGYVEKWRNGFTEIT